MSQNPESLQSWQSSDQFKLTRILGNLCAEMTQKIRQIHDIYVILEKDITSDKCSLFESQLRIVSLEIENLRQRMSDVELVFQDEEKINTVMQL